MRRPFALRTGTFIVCAVIAAGAITAWFLSYAPNRKNPPSFRLLGARYTLRSERGHFRLLGPPPHPAAADPAAWALVEQLSNQHLSWQVRVPWTGVKPRFTTSAHTTGDQVRLLSTADSTRPLLEALEDPNRFAVAHLWLTEKHLRGGGYNPATHDHGDHLIGVHDGLHVVLRPSLALLDAKALDEEFKRKQRQEQLLFELCRGPAAVQIAPGQLPWIRRQWHDRLDVRVFSIPYAAILAVTLLPPAIALFKWWRTNRDARHAPGRCRACGYDLRAGHDVCPECGRPCDPPRDIRTTPASDVAAPSLPIDDHMAR